MNRLALFFILIFPLSLGATGLDALSETEMRVNNFLSAHLKKSEYMVYVSKLNPKKVAARAQKVPDATSLPGLPGFNESDSQNPYSFDIGKSALAKPHRPALEINVVLSNKLLPNKAAFFKKVLPQIARVDRARGDSFSMRLGPIDRAPASLSETAEKIIVMQNPSAEQASGLAVLFENKREVFSLLVGIFFGLAVLVGLNGYFRRRSDAEATAQGTPQYPPMGAATYPSLGHQTGTQEGGDEHSATRKIHAVGPSLSLIRELRQEAEAHPERFSSLFTQWIQEGVPGQTSAGILLGLFEFAIINRITESMVPSDLDLINRHFRVEYDFDTDEGVFVLGKAKKDLLKIAAQEKNKSGDRFESLDFVKAMEEDQLLELVRNEPPETLVFLSTLVPSHRIKPVIDRLSPEDQVAYFTGICRINEMPQAIRDQISERLIETKKDVDENIMTQNQRAQSIKRSLKAITDSERKRRVVDSLISVDPETFSLIEQDILFLEDVYELETRYLRLILSELPADQLAVAFRGADRKLHEKFIKAMNDSQREIFLFELRTPDKPSRDEVSTARTSLIESLDRLLELGMIPRTQIKRTAPKQVGLKSA